MKYLVAIKGKFGKKKNPIFSFPDRTARSSFLKAIIEELGADTEYALSSVK